MILLIFMLHITVRTLEWLKYYRVDKLYCVHVILGYYRGDLHTICYKRGALVLRVWRSAIQIELAAPSNFAVVESHGNGCPLGYHGYGLCPGTLSGDCSGAGPPAAVTQVPQPQPCTLYVGPGLTQLLGAGQTRRCLLDPGKLGAGFKLIKFWGLA